MTSSENGITKSRKSRLFKMAAKMAVQQGKKYLKSNPESKLNILVQQADTLVNQVGQLKGAAMKAVQTLSVEGQDFIPPEVMQVLEKLQSQAPPVNTEILMQELKEQLSEAAFNDLKDISSEPLAAASIGQVYSATLHGQDVVIKIQYPGVAESVDADIDTLKKLLKGLLFVSGKSIDFEELMEEVRRVLKLETDYVHEAQILKRYKKLFEGSDYIIPDVFEDYSTSRVLVMSREVGLEFTDWVKSNPTEEHKQKVAESLLNLYIKEFFEHQLVQTDPNPANFLVNDQGQMVLLDFGATIEFEMDFVKDYQGLVRVVFSGDRAAILEQVFVLGFIQRDESEQTRNAFVDFLLLSMAPFEEKRQPFDFSDKSYSSLVRDEAMKFSKMLDHSAPPKNLIFLHRKLGGIFNLLKKMEVQKDLTGFRDLMLSKDF